MRQEEMIGIIATTIIVTFALIVVINPTLFKSQDYMQHVKPYYLDYDECEIIKINTSVPFLIKIIHEPVIEENFITYHFDPESIMVVEKTDSSLLMNSKSIDTWYIQVSLNYEEEKERETKIEYNLGEKRTTELVKDDSSQWCKIFEIHSRGSFLS